MFPWQFRLPRLGAGALVLIVCACGQPTIDVDANADIALPDGMLSDAASDAGPEVAADVVCAMYPVPPVQVAGTSETDSLARAPARCGQNAHAWRADPMLGTVTARGMHTRYTTNTLRVLAGAVFANASSVVGSDVDVDQLAYTTQDRGALHTATMMIARPVRRTDAAMLDVILFAHGTSGVNDRCAPSNDELARVLVSVVASTGYVVVAPDYIGLRAFGSPTGFLHPYLAGQPTAIASLDAVRAGVRFLASERGPVCASTRYVTVGGSQGGHAALWIDRLAPYYLREFRHMGVVATVPPADVTGEIALALRSVIPATQNSVAIIAALAPWYGLDGRLGEVFRAPYDTRIPMNLATSCGVSGARVDVLTDAFQPAILAAAASTDILHALVPWGCLLGENSLTTTSVPRIPSTEPGYGVLYVLGERDELVSTTIERGSFRSLCARGMQMQYLECAGAQHVQATLWSMPEILDFVRDRLAGRPPVPSDACVVRPATRCRGTM